MLVRSWSKIQSFDWIRLASRSFIHIVDRVDSLKSIKHSRKEMEKTNEIEKELSWKGWGEGKRKEDSTCLECNVCIRSRWKQPQQTQGKATRVHIENSQTTPPSRSLPYILFWKSLILYKQSWNGSRHFVKTSSYGLLEMSSSELLEVSSSELLRHQINDKSTQTRTLPMCHNCSFVTRTLKKSNSEQFFEWKAWILKKVSDRWDVEKKIKRAKKIFEKKKKKIFQSLKLFWYLFAFYWEKAFHLNKRSFYYFNSPGDLWNDYFQVILGKNNLVIGGK